MSKLIDLTGAKFGDLKVVARSKDNSHGHPLWLCVCSCGKKALVSGCNLRTGNSTRCLSCKYGLTRKQRCLRPYEALYRILRRTPSGHAVKLSYEEFLEFTQIERCHYCDALIEWAQFIPEGSAYNLDRKDTNGPYSRDNCVVCCKRCNIGKGRLFTYEEWKQIGALIRSWKK